MRLKVLALCLTFITSLLSHSYAADSPKAGATCSKVGSTKTYQGKKFTCIKSGKKLVWNKGVTVKTTSSAVTPKPPSTVSENSASTPTINPNSVSSLSSDPRITPSNDLSNLDICKTIDQTPDYAPLDQNIMRNGFPRPRTSSYEVKSAQVLFIPISFTDRPFLKTSRNSSQPMSDLDFAKKAMSDIEAGFKKLSAGRFQVKVDILPETEWWEFNVPSPIIGEWGVNNFPDVVKLIEERKPNFTFNDYDAFVLVGSHSSRGGAAQANFGQALKNAKNGRANLVLMTENALSSTNTFIHELGHALFAFEDLYLFNPQETRVDAGLSSASAPDGWDLMGKWSTLELLNWNRLLAGWLKDSEVRCIVDQKSSVHYLIPFNNGVEPKLVLINLAEGVTLAAEARDFGNEKKLLVYTIDTYISHGKGPIKTSNELLVKGRSHSVYGWDITVIDNNSEGVLVEVTKTDLNKYVVPDKPKQTTQSQPPGNTIRLTGGDITRKGTTKAEIRWNPLNYESYRIFVTAIDNSQKVYFETGFRDTNVNPLSVELTGLTCEIDLRVVSMFFTGKQGQGQSKIEERIINRSQC